MSKNKNILLGIFSLLFSLTAVVLISITFVNNKILFGFFADPLEVIVLMLSQLPQLIKGGIMAVSAFLLGMLSVILGSLKDKTDRDGGFHLARTGGILGYLGLVLAFMWILYIAIIGYFNTVLLYDFILAGP